MGFGAKLQVKSCPRKKGDTMTYTEAKEKLAKYGVVHVLAYYDSLSDADKAALLFQIEDTDFSVLEVYKNRNDEVKKGKIEPLPAMELAEIEEKQQIKEELQQEKEELTELMDSERNENFIVRMARRFWGLFFPDEEVYYNDYGS